MRSRMQQMKENGNRWRAEKKSNEMNSENIKIRESLEVGDVCVFSSFIDRKWCVPLRMEINAAVGNADVTEDLFCFALGHVGEAFKTSTVFFCGFLLDISLKMQSLCSWRFNQLCGANRCCPPHTAESSCPWPSVGHGDGQQCEIWHWYLFSVFA